MRSGFATVVGRPNVGKSTLVNSMVGSKVAITSPRPNTTRHRIRGVVHRGGAQVVLVDTPGLHRPRTALGRRLNETAASALHDVDVVVAVLDATAPIGPGDRMVLERCRRVVHAGSGGVPDPSGAARSVDEGSSAAAGLMVAVNKVDGAPTAAVLEHLAGAAQLLEDVPGVDYFPVSARLGSGVDALVAGVVARLPEGPPYFPPGMLTDTPEAEWVAELVREQLLVRVRDELPHSIACRVTEWEWPRIRCEILVERSSQKGIVIGVGGEVLKEVGTAVRAQLPEGAYIELAVRVEKRWQQRQDALDQLGY